MELVVDLFAGGGGVSTGIEAALGRSVDVAINHDPEAIAMHRANHPHARHYVSDVFEIDPVEVAEGRSVGLLWASPDCTYHSKARGGKPFRKRGQANKRRALAGVVIRWAKTVRPRVIALENVEEFQYWGPLDASGTPCSKRRGSSFQRWVASLRNLGYQVEWRELRACDYGAPTIRKRLFLIARCDGQPIVWPQSTHAAPDSLPVRQGVLQAWRTAAECIDWSQPTPSIFERSKPLADATCRRIAKGIMRYVINAKNPFIAPVPPAAAGVVSMEKCGLVAAFLAKHYTGVIGVDLRNPLSTVTSVDHHSLVTAHLVHMGHGEGRAGTARFSHGIRDVRAPLNTVTASGMPAALITSHLLVNTTGHAGGRVNQPLHTIATGGHHAEVRAFMIKYYGNEKGGCEIEQPLHTIPTHDRFALVNVNISGHDYIIADIGMRMLTPRELYKAQGFPEGYIIHCRAKGFPITKTAQIRMCGNSVPPPVVEALIKANYQEQPLRMAA